LYLDNKFPPAPVTQARRDEWRVGQRVDLRHELFDDSTLKGAEGSASSDPFVSRRLERPEKGQPRTEAAGGQPAPNRLAALPQLASQSLFGATHRDGGLAVRSALKVALNDRRAIPGT
jgi:hypothetical protein